MRKLFLHFGPGGNASIERELYSNEEIVFWDQPGVNDGVNSFSESVTACIGKVNEITNNGSDKLTLICNSYGAVLGTKVCELIPDIINKIHILASQPCLYVTYTNLLKYLIEKYPDKSELKLSLKQFQDNRDVESFWAMAACAMSIPGMMDSYWFDKSLDSYKLWNEKLNNGLLMDNQTMQVILNDHLQSGSFFKSISQKKISVVAKVFLAKHDPFSDSVNDRELWSSIFDTVEFREIDSGHYIHLERPINEWT